MPHALALSLAVTLLAASPSAAADDPIEAVPSLPPIVGGHHIQPRESGSGSDVSPGDATDVDRLYQQLMRQTAPDTQGGDDHVDRLYQQLAPGAGSSKPP
jgi:hypothetical protein